MPVTSRHRRRTPFAVLPAALASFACAAAGLVAPGPAQAAPPGPGPSAVARADAARVGRTTGVPPTWSGKVPPLATPWTSLVTPANALPDYPRPQLARPSAAAPRWVSLNGLWQYAPTDGFSAPPIGRDLTGKILVPYPEESALSGVQQHSDFAFYRRVGTLPRGLLRAGEHLRLNFGAVDYDATVWVNGVRVVQHRGGYDSFGADVTGALRAGGAGPQEIVVGVQSPVDGATVPVGKQRLDPGGIFYTPASGIWQSVWLEPVPATSLATVTATPDPTRTSFTVASTVNGDPAGTKLTVDAYAAGAKVGSVTGAPGAPLTLTVPKPHLWTPDDPFLYTFAATLSGGGGRDRVETYAAMRTVAVADVGGKQRIVLNGKPTFLQATLDQGYWPDGIYTAPTDAALRFDIQKTKDLGFNTIRKHIKVEPARWYAWADRLGMMVWQDVPSLPTGRNASLTTADKANFRDEARRIVDQLRGVPSIIGWVPFNEGWGQWSVQAASEVGAQLKSQDPTRLVDDRSGSNCCDTPGDPGTGDVIDWHSYQGPALPAPDATRASMDGEHGGLTLPIEGHTYPGASLNPYGAVKDRAALNDGYVANTAVLRDQGAPYGLSGAVYTQITDVENELNGLFTYDRQVEKVDEARVRAVNRQVIAAGARATPVPPPGRPGLTGIGHWTLDEGSGTTAADRSGGAPLTLTGGAGWTPGLSGSALALNGQNQAAGTSAKVIDTEGTNYSVSAWVRFNRVDGAFQTIASQDGDQVSAFFLQYSGADRRLAFSFAGARSLATTVGEPTAGRWYHVVGVRDITAGKLMVYVDGQLAGSLGVLGSTDTSTGPFVVGRGKFGGKPVDYLDGAVDDVRAYDRALTAADVTALFQGGAKPTP